MPHSDQPRVSVVYPPDPIELALAHAIALAGPPKIPRRGWVIIKPNIVCCPGLSPQYGRGTVSDLRVVRELVRWLVEDGRAARITIAEGAGGWKPATLDGWSTDWNGEFGGLTYRGIAREFGVELLDLNFAESVDWLRGGRLYRLARAVRDCDCLISHSPLKTNIGTGVSLAIKNLFGIAPGSVYGFPKFGLHALGPLNELAVDLLEFRPDTYAVLGGPWGIEGEGDTPVEHGVLVCGSNAVAVDAVGAAVMGFDNEELEFLPMAARRGLGACRLRRIRVEGNSIEEARRPFRRPAQWEVACL